MKNIFIFLTIFLFSTNNSSLFSQNVYAGNLNNYRTLEITSSNLQIDSGNVRTLYLSQSGLSIYDLRFHISTSASESVKEILNPNLTKKYTLMIYIRKTSNDSYVYGNFYNFNIPVETLNSNIVIPLSTKLNFVRGLSNLDILQAGYTYEFIFTRAIGED